MRWYFDHNATTPVTPEVMDAFIPALTHVYGNASSIHQDGQNAKKHLDAARREVAALLGAKPAEIVLLSGGTEANNLALFGAVRAARKPRPHVVTTAIEHPAVLNPLEQLACGAAEITVLPAGPSGVVDPDDVARAIRPETVLISVMHANNEIGTIQPIEAISRIARDRGVLFHSDGVQAAGKIPVDVNALGVDLYSISGHKFGAPKGVGALYVRQGVTLTPLLCGGRHERERRAGTENVPGFVALGRAAATIQRPDAALRDRLERGILQRVRDARVNCAASPRLPNTTSIQFDGIEGEALVIALDLRGFAVSSGAACSSGAVTPSHVLTAIGLSRCQARSTLRFSLGRGNTAMQVDDLIEAVAASVVHLRKVSPAYAG